jgi:DNA mismatch repair protein MutS2
VPIQFSYFCKKITKVIFPENFENKIDFDQIRLMLRDKCVSEMGRDYVAAMHFITHFETLRQRLGQTEEFRQILMFGKTFPAQNYFNLIPELRRIQISGTHLLQENLFDLKTSLQSIFDVIVYLRQLDAEKFPLLRELVRDVDVERLILREIERIMDDRGRIKDRASDKLSEIRNGLSKLSGEVDRAIRKILLQARKSGWVNPNDDITIRNGRLVIPVPATHKRKIRGFIQDESSSGQTVFIEPAESLEANNEIRELENAEKREINKILTVFTDFLRPHAESVIEAYQFLGLIDFIRAKASLALKLEAGIPILNNHPVIEWWEARHPLLFLAHQKQKKEIVPLEIKLKEQERILVISGPNAGGKSVCLKTVGLLQYMLQCGLPVPMRETSEAGIFKDIFIDIGDEQSIENDLSTYTSHLRNMKYFALKAGKSSLFLIDEFGTGTEPRMGGAIAEAVLEHLNQKESYGVITTHYTNLKILADKTTGLINGAMLFDTRKMQPLFRLQIGNPGSSFAFEMAKKTGLPWYILRSAEKKVGKTQVKFDKQLQQLEVEKREVADKQKELSVVEKRLNELTSKYAALKNEIETNKARIIKDARKEAQQIIDDSNKLIENTIREIREAQADKEKTKALRDQLKTKKSVSEKSIQDQQKTSVAKVPKIKARKPGYDSKTILTGNRVRIPPQSTVGEVIELSGGEAVVSFGSVVMKVPVAKLVNVGEEEYHEKVLFKKRSYGNILNDLNDKMANFKLSLDLRGQRAEEAATELRRYIDEAMLLSIKEVKILHGKGNGVLRDVIRDQLRLIPEVKRFGDEKIEMGGSGITIVILK